MPREKCQSVPFFPLFPLPEKKLVNPGQSSLTIAEGTSVAPWHTEAKVPFFLKRGQSIGLLLPRFNTDHRRAWFRSRILRVT